MQCGCQSRREVVDLFRLLRRLIRNSKAREHFLRCGLKFTVLLGDVDGQPTSIGHHGRARSSSFVLGLFPVGLSKTKLDGQPIRVTTFIGSLLLYPLFGTLDGQFFLVHLLVKPTFNSTA